MGSDAIPKTAFLFSLRIGGLLGVGKTQTHLVTRSVIKWSIVWSIRKNNKSFSSTLGFVVHIIQLYLGIRRALFQDPPWTPKSSSAQVPYIKWRRTAPPHANTYLDKEGQLYSYWTALLYNHGRILPTDTSRGKSLASGPTSLSVPSEVGQR